MVNSGIAVGSVCYVFIFGRRFGVTCPEFVAEEIDNGDPDNLDYRARSDASALFGGIVRPFELTVVYFELDVAIIRFTGDMSDVIPLSITCSAYCSQEVFLWWFSRHHDEQLQLASAPGRALDAQGSWFREAVFFTSLKELGRGGAVVIRNDADDPYFAGILLGEASDERNQYLVNQYVPDHFIHLKWIDNKPASDESHPLLGHSHTDRPAASSTPSSQPVSSSAAAAESSRPLATPPTPCLTPCPPSVSSSSSPAAPHTQEGKEESKRIIRGLYLPTVTLLHAIGRANLRVRSDPIPEPTPAPRTCRRRLCSSCIAF